MVIVISGFERTDLYKKRFSRFSGLSAGFVYQYLNGIIKLKFTKK